MARKTAVNVRIDGHLYDTIASYAKEQNLSVTRAVNQLLERAIQAEKVTKRQKRGGEDP